LRSLHPSAAVLGYPRDIAWQTLRVQESFSRGWYAGPIGWVTRDRAEFAVAIRSALLTEAQRNNPSRRDLPKILVYPRNQKLNHRHNAILCLMFLAYDT
ncbi:chorismate-binding protein, partial [Planctomycetota bacterium]